ncbi:MAG: prolipoprotein diacylglyceryl transferase [Candidatus Riflebacteria bacterium]|nr:prolipoprotein diacylglyceryl transferase [Candidatus Riflebacteria bacterium]
MYPILFEIGPLRIGSYGVTLAIAFICAFLLINWQFRKNDCDVELAWDLHFLAIFGGMLGSRLMFIIENFRAFLADPLSMIFSTTGFSVLGGYVLALLLCIFRVRAAGQPFFRIADIYVPGMAVGYAVGRLGCIVAGDGCYGLPCELPWAMSFPKGLVSTLSAQNPSLAATYMHMFPGKPLPTDIFVHPTPLYESLSTIILLLILLLINWKIGSGRRFAFFLVWFGVSRFLVEFIRLNPFDYWGLSSSQLVSLFFIVAGIIIAATSSARFKKIDSAGD